MLKIRRDRANCHNVLSCVGGTKINTPNNSEVILKIKVLNLYAGIGGNRKLWEDDKYDVTAVEFDKAIADAYQSRFPNDVVVVGDAKQYLLDHYKEFDFIWASPPCQSHSDIRRMGAMTGQYDAILPDMTLYSMIIFLNTFFKGSFVVENVKPYYTPLIKESAAIDRHLYWSNFNITVIEVTKDRIHQHTKGNELEEILGTNKHNIKNKVQVVRNQVNYEIGLHIINCAFSTIPHKQGGFF